MEILLFFFFFWMSKFEAYLLPGDNMKNNLFSLHELNTLPKIISN